MGWTSFMVNPFNFNRKAELDKELWFGEKNHELLRSVMIGSTYYGAAKYKPTGKVYALVCLTHLEDGEFFYKEMTEDMGPCERKCPESILKLLSPTDSEFALEWRKDCHAYNTLEKLYKSKKTIEGELKRDLNDEYKKGMTIKLYYRKMQYIRSGRTKGYYTDGVYKWSKKLVLELDNLRLATPFM